MFKLSYSTNGLTNLTLNKAIQEIKKAGFDGVELSFQEKQFNPFTLSNDDLLKIKDYFTQANVKPVCISTATTFFLSKTAHEPSLLSIDQEKRKKRINLIKRGIEIAKILGVPVVSFQSGYIREEHLKKPSINPREFLISGIKECLNDIGDIILVIEPEPGMYIETLEDAVKLINEVNSNNFKLHIDIGHAYCTENNYIKALEQYSPFTEYMHLADIKEGYNLKFIESSLENIKNLNLDFNYASYLINIAGSNKFIFMSNHECICFYDGELISSDYMENFKSFLTSICYNIEPSFKSITDLNETKISKDLTLEIKAFLDSISGIGFDVLNKCIPILKYLRSEPDSEEKTIITMPICNTVNGKVHYHELPGNGQIDFNGVFKALKDNYDKFITVELYNHSDMWDYALPESRKYLLNCINGN